MFRIKNEYQKYFQVCHFLITKKKNLSLHATIVAISVLPATLCINDLDSTYTNPLEEKALQPDN